VEAVDKNIRLRSIDAGGEGTVCDHPLSRYASTRVAAIHLAGRSGGVFFYALYCIHEEEGASSGFAVGVR
jgi:hypothetical protein